MRPSLGGCLPHMFLNVPSPPNPLPLSTPFSHPSSPHPRLRSVSALRGAECRHDQWGARHDGRAACQDLVLDRIGLFIPAHRFLFPTRAPLLPKCFRFLRPWGRREWVGGGRVGHPRIMRSHPPPPPPPHPLDRRPVMVSAKSQRTSTPRRWGDRIE